MTGVGRGALLLVDDEPAVLRTLAALFDDEFDVAVAGTVEHATDLLARRAFDVVVVDFYFPGGATGFDVLRAAAVVQPQAIGIVYTGRAELARARGSAATWRVFPKSNDPEVLLLAVRTAAATVQANRVASR